MTDLRKLLDRASKGKWSTVGPTLVIPWHSNHAMPIELSIANAELVAAAVNALPDMLLAADAATKERDALAMKVHELRLAVSHIRHFAEGEWTPTNSVHRLDGIKFWARHTLDRTK